MEVGRHDLHPCLAIERADSSEHLIIHTTHRIQIGSGIQRNSLELLGSHEIDRTEYRLKTFDFLFGLGLGKCGQSEVHDF